MGFRQRIDAAGYCFEPEYFLRDYDLGKERP
jgi:hypothetical protein